MSDNDPYEKYKDFKGPSDEELTAAYRQHRHPLQFRGMGSSIQTSGQNFIGTPRKAKHRGRKVGGVTLK